MDFDTRVGCYAWIEQDGQVLLPHWREWSASGRELAGWTLPGGGVEIGETPQECCLREVREETGHEVELTGLLGVRNHWVAAEDRIRHPGRPLQVLQVVFVAQITAGTLTVEVGGTTDEVRWVPLDQVGALSTVSLVDSALGWARAPGRTR